MRPFLAAGLAILATVPMLRAAVVDFADVPDGNYQGSTTAKDTDDVLTFATDGLQWGARSYDGTSGNDLTNAIGNKVIPNNWQGKLLLRPVANGDADAGNDVVFSITSLDVVKRWDNADCVVTGYKADGSTVTERRRIGYGGLITVAVPVSADGALAGKPLIRPFGVPVEEDRDDFIADATDAATKAYSPGVDEDRVRESVRLAVRRCATLWTGKKPLVEVMLLEVA
jgi:hypothetical protein